MAMTGQDHLLKAARAFSILSQVLLGLCGIATTAIWVSNAVFGFGRTSQTFFAAIGMRPEYLPGIPFSMQLLIGIAAIAALFAFFGKLRAIIDTVERSDPFEPANADRLTLMAWLLLGVHAAYWIPRLATIGVERVYVNGYSPHIQTITFDALDLIGFVLILTLFILARVFRHGAAMRADLEGTV